MTYMPDSHFSDDFVTPAEQNASTVEKIKVLTKEGAVRSQRVVKILKTAFSETAAEVKDGRAALSPLAKEVTAETVDTVKSKSQQAADVLNSTWQQESDKKDLTDRIIAFTRSLASTLKVTLLPQVKAQSGKLDVILSDRYGQRYSSIKDQFEAVRSWQTTSKADSVTTADERAATETDSSVVIEVESEIVS